MTPQSSSNGTAAHNDNDRTYDAKNRTDDDNNRTYDAANAAQTAPLLMNLCYAYMLGGS